MQHVCHVTCEYEWKSLALHFKNCRSDAKAKSEIDVEKATRGAMDHDVVVVPVTESENI